MQLQRNPIATGIQCSLGLCLIVYAILSGYYGLQQHGDKKHSFAAFSSLLFVTFSMGVGLISWMLVRPVTAMMKLYWKIHLIPNVPAFFFTIWFWSTGCSQITNTSSLYLIFAAVCLVALWCVLLAAIFPESILGVYLIPLWDEAADELEKDAQIPAKEVEEA